ncbi:hypothetical protein K378_01475 [Streptomyces sp. Amel2xB2]|uniref:hypothetical protein n=1 Tax=Streptomyces sp. Amel2xB2 TaxID=1305829 RepID=UPI000DC0002C|nr:hypothetical protein [Streptomyces sp. Amel2xB2]RAJ70310.1 hypothetical protein K378_01475 [Streptomyces sp. Amel2xB2]
MKRSEAIRIHENNAAYYERSAAKASGSTKRELLEAAAEEAARAEAARNGTHPAALTD